MYSVFRSRFRRPKILHGCNPSLIAFSRHRTAKSPVRVSCASLGDSRPPSFASSSLTFLGLPSGGVARFVLSVPLRSFLRRFIRCESIVTRPSRSLRPSALPSLRDPDPDPADPEPLSFRAPCLALCPPVLRRSFASFDPLVSKSESEDLSLPFPELDRPLDARARRSGAGCPRTAPVRGMAVTRAIRSFLPTSTREREFAATRL